MNTILALALALAAAASAGSSVKSKGEGKNVEDRGVERSGGSATGGADASHASGAGLPIPKELSPSIVWVAYPRLKDLPEKNGSHGVMRVPNKNVGWAIGFKTGEPPKGEFRSGHCGIGESPKTPHHGACHRYLWIAAVPGGGPVSSKCVEGPAGRHVTVNWVTYGPETKKALWSHCELEPGRRYYCHYAATGFDRTDEDRPSNCDYTMGSPISYEPD